MKILKLGLLSIMAILLLTSFEFTATAPMPRHCKGVDMYFYATAGAAFANLMAGTDDIMYYPLDHTQIAAVTASLTHQIAEYNGNDIYGLDINSNYSIADYPSIRNPLNLEVRAH